MLSGGNQTGGNSHERFLTPYQNSRLPLNVNKAGLIKFCSETAEMSKEKVKVKCSGTLQFNWIAKIGTMQFNFAKIKIL